MGYTHYWTFKRGDVTPAELAERFAEASADARKLYNSLKTGPDAVKIVGWDRDKPKSRPVFNADLVQFNGLGDDGHESFSLARVDAADGDFCKTARKPYDILVCATLLVFDHHFQPVFTAGTDGGYEDWEPAIQLVNKVLGMDGLKNAPKNVIAGWKDTQ